MQMIMIYIKSALLIDHQIFNEKQSGRTAVYLNCFIMPCAQNQTESLKFCIGILALHATQ